VLSLLGGHLRSDILPPGGSRSHELALAILNREIHYRSFAFASRFVAGYDVIKAEQSELFRDTLPEVWKPILRELRDEAACSTLARAIHLKAKDLAIIPELRAQAENIRPEDILVDLPTNKVAARGSDILTRTDAGVLGTPNLFFDPERWSNAYEQQKHCGFVFTPRKYVQLVALASRLVFFERFRVVMGEPADRASKTSGDVKPEWIEAAATAGLCSAEAREQLMQPKPLWLKLEPGDIELPQEWLDEDPGITGNIAQALNEAIPQGVTPATKAGIQAAITQLSFFVVMSEQGGTFVAQENLLEKQLQERLRDHIRSGREKVWEGMEVGGGETDLVLQTGPVLIENKVNRKPTDNPMEIQADPAWQARRYAIALCSSVWVVVMAYRPADERAILRQTQRLKVLESVSGDRSGPCQLRVVVPWGHNVPSRVKAP
jgi:hypothetical protein